MKNSSLFERSLRSEFWNFSSLRFATAEFFVSVNEFRTCQSKEWGAVSLLPFFGQAKKGRGSLKENVKCVLLLEKASQQLRLAKP